MAALRELPEERSRLYFDVIMAALPELARRTLEAHMEGYEYQSEFARKYVAQGREEGRKEGRSEGRSEGREEGRTVGMQEGQRAAVLALARLKVGTLSAAQAARIHALEDSAALTGLLLELGMARDAEEARAVLARLADSR
jgi:predicted transposase YdaD